MVPHLVTALSGPLLDLEKRILDYTTDIECWLRFEWSEQTPPFYSSVDIRNAGFKLAPVDTNLFPGGFNNLSDDMLPLAVQAVMSSIEKYCPSARSVVVVPENHTRNTYYLSNLSQLMRILRQAGLDARLGSLSDEITTKTELETANGDHLQIEPLCRHGNRLGVNGFEPCAVLLNNDLSAGVPNILKGLDEQYLLPPLHAGWATRRKSRHFQAYQEITDRFCRQFDFDPWLITPYFESKSQLNFQQRLGEQALAEAVDSVLEQTRRKYSEYGITEKPYVVVKADAGTYGMGIMTAHDAQDVIGLNRKQRNKMSKVKEGLEVSDVIIQEGVHTFESIKGAVAEPVVYMIDRYVIGGFYRIHTGRAKNENLNAPGMQFLPLAFETPCNTPDCSDRPDAAVNRFYSYGVIARLAALAAAKELELTKPNELAA